MKRKQKASSSEAFFNSPNKNQEKTREKRIEAVNREQKTSSSKATSDYSPQDKKKKKKQVGESRTEAVKRVQKLPPPRSLLSFTCKLFG